MQQQQQQQQQQQRRRRNKTLVKKIQEYHFLANARTYKETRKLAPAYSKAFRAFAMELYPAAYQEDLDERWELHENDEFIHEFSFA